MGLVKLSILSNNYSVYSYPRMSCIMFHKVDAMYRELKNQETLQASLAIQNLKSLIFSLPPQIYQPPELNLPGNLQ